LSNRKVLIDLYKIKDPFTGLGQFSLNFAATLQQQQGTGFDFDFLIPGHSAAVPEKHSVQANIIRRYFPFRNSGYNIWHSLHQFPSHFPDRWTKQLLTIHDLNFLKEKNKEKAARYLKLLQKNITKATAITAISGYTKAHILEHLDVGGRHIHVIYNGVSLPVAPAVQPAFIDTSRKFFLSLGVFKQGKNFHTLLPLMRFFPDHCLVIAGNKDTEYGRELAAQIAQLNLQDRVMLPGTVADGEKRWLYENMEAFLFPSLAEGFGLPVIEAMMCGKPVFLSTETCLPEIGGDAAFYFKEFAPESMADAVHTGLSLVQANPASFASATKDYASKFGWQQCIEGYLQVYRSL